MYLMYVDESGDPGTTGSPSNFYFLSALVVHETFWLRLLSDSIQLRRMLKSTKGLLMREEIHAAVFVNGRANLKNNISRNDKLDILKTCLKWLGTKNYLNIITVKVDKTNNPDPFTIAWRTLIQRFENTLKHQNFPNPAFARDSGIIVADNTDRDKLKTLLRKMRKINFIPSQFAGSPPRNMPLRLVIKDPIFRDSSHSYIVQLIDIVVYFARQYFFPNKYIKKKGAANYYGKLGPIINQHASSNSNNFRIVSL